MSVPMSSAAAIPMARPIAQPSRVWPTAVHSVPSAAWCHRALAVCVIEGNSSARMTPATLSHCQRPSAAASTPNLSNQRRNAYRSASRLTVTGSRSSTRGPALWR
jgi:hypothetical protein